MQIGARVFAKLDAITKGGYAEYAVLPMGDAVPIPAGLDFATAAAIPTAGLTGIQMVEHYARPEPGAVVLVTGAVGAVGRFAAYAARNRGARVIAAVREAQVDAARSLGADRVVILGADNWDGPAFDVVLDTVGGAVAGKLRRHLAPAGRVFTASTTPIDAAPLASEPVFVMIRSDPKTLQALAQAVAARAIEVSIARRLPLGDAGTAHRLVEAGGNSGKIILES